MYFSTRNLYILSENTSIYCSSIIVVHVHATYIQKSTQRVTILQTLSNQEVTKKTGKHAADCSKAVCWCVK